MMQGWCCVESLTGQRHDRVQTESQIATVDSCFDLVGSLQHGAASCEVFSWSTDIHKPTICRWWWPQMKLKSKSLPIGQCHMQNAWQGTTGNWGQTQTVPQENHGETMLKMSCIWELKYRTTEHNDAKGRKRKCCLFRLRSFASLCWTVLLQAELDDTKSCYQLIIKIAIFEKRRIAKLRKKGIICIKSLTKEAEIV